MRRSCIVYALCMHFECLCIHRGGIVYALPCMLHFDSHTLPYRAPYCASVALICGAERSTYSLPASVSQEY